MRVHGANIKGNITGFLVVFMSLGPNITHYGIGA